MHNGRPDAKKLVWMMAGAQVKTTAKGGGGYRWLYDETKAKYAEKVHSKDCTGGYSGPLYVKCKTHRDPDAAPDAKPGYALEGDPFQPSHVHAIALRRVGKEILRDLWLAAGPDPRAALVQDPEQRDIARHGTAAQRERVLSTTVRGGLGGH
jgi:hypothetical protein